MKHDAPCFKCSTSLPIPPSTSTFVHALATCYSKNINVKCVEWLRAPLLSSYETYVELFFKIKTCNDKTTDNK